MERREFLSGLALSLRRDRMEAASRLIEAQTASGDVSAAVLRVAQGRDVYLKSFGAARTPDTVFLLASITKPMTAAGVMILRDRGALSLNDPVRKFIPEFHGADREGITVRHLLTHTSGLPDMLPENVELRKRHAPLKDFVAGACRTPLLFKPGSEVRYQSMGILLASEILERVAKMPARDFLRRQLFLPLGMKQTSLGLGGRRIPNTAQCQVEQKSDWDWNSPYWRDLGAPWGGAHSTAADVARLLEFFIDPRPPVIKAATAADMIRNQNAGLNKPWGLGWMTEPGAFGKGCSAATFGHYGSTGTVAWLDPASGLSCVLLTTKPAESSRHHLLGPVADAVSALQ